MKELFYKKNKYSILTIVLVIVVILLSYWLWLREKVTIYVLKLPSGHIFIAEDPNHPQLKKFRKKEHLDKIIALFPNDLDKLLAIAQWTSKLFEASDPFVNYPPWNAQKILSMIREGKTGGFCAQYAHIFGQSCQSLGYPVRYVDLANKYMNDSHFITEVYLSSLKKWIAFEPSLGNYYIDKKGQPLSVLELHEGAIDSKKENVYQFPGKVIVPPTRLGLFYYYRYYLRNNFLSIPVYYMYTKLSPKITAMVFEPYRLVWIDEYIQDTKELNISLKSSKKEDFDFYIDFNKFVRINCSSVKEFNRIVKEGKTGNLYKIYISSNQLQLVIESLFDNRGYQQLK